MTITDSVKAEINGAKDIYDIVNAMSPVLEEDRKAYDSKIDDFIVKNFPPPDRDDRAALIARMEKMQFSKEIIDREKRALESFTGVKVVNGGKVFSYDADATAALVTGQTVDTISEGKRGDKYIINSRALNKSKSAGDILKQVYSDSLLMFGGLIDSGNMTVPEDKALAAAVAAGLISKETLSADEKKAINLEHLENVDRYTIKQEPKQPDPKKEDGSFTDTDIQGRAVEYQFIRGPKGAEKHTGAARMRGYTTIDRKDGYDMVYMEYGRDGAGYYYRKFISTVADEPVAPLPPEPLTASEAQTIADNTVLPPRAKYTKDELIKIDVAALDSAWEKQGDSFYVGKGGTGAAIKGRYPDFLKWLRENPGTPVEAPEISFSDRDGGTVSFSNGRHRFSVLRDAGARTMMIAMNPKEIPIAQSMGIVAPKSIKKPDVTRSRPTAGITFNNITGPSGAKLVGYSWSWKPIEEINKRGEEVIRKISEWDNADSSAHTGRDIVHKFIVQETDGSQKTVSLESAISILGYTDKTGGAVKSIAGLAKRVAVLKMSIAEIEPLLSQYDDAVAKANAMTPPEPTISDLEGSKEGTKVYSMGSARVMVSNWMRAGAGDDNTVLRGRLKTLEKSWRDNQAFEISGLSSDPHQLYGELKDKLYLAEAKLSKVAG